MEANESDYRRGLGRALRRDQRGTPGEATFRANFVNGVLPQRDSCELCDAGAGRFKMKRQYIHYIDRRAVVCTKD